MGKHSSAVVWEQTAHINTQDWFVRVAAIAAVQNLFCPPPHRPEMGDSNSDANNAEKCLPMMITKCEHLLHLNNQNKDLPPSHNPKFLHQECNSTPDTM